MVQRLASLSADFPVTSEVGCLCSHVSWGVLFGDIESFAFSGYQTHVSYMMGTCVLPCCAFSYCLHTAF